MPIAPPTKAIRCVRVRYVPDRRSSSLPGLGPDTGAAGGGLDGGGTGAAGVVGACANAKAGTANVTRMARTRGRTARKAYGTARVALRTIGVRISVRIASEATMSSGICHVQPWVTPNASELFSECRAMQGSSDPVWA